MTSAQTAVRIRAKALTNSAGITAGCCTGGDTGCGSKNTGASHGTIRQGLEMLVAYCPSVWSENYAQRFPFAGPDAKQRAPALPPRLIERPAQAEYSADSHRRAG